jgi:hypothetical protein
LSVFSVRHQESVPRKSSLAIALVGFALALLCSVLMPVAPARAACTVPNSITNGQVADATAVMGNFNALKGCADGAVTPTGTPAAGNLATFSSSQTITNGNLSGDCTTSGTLAVTCTKSNGASLGYFATGTDASHLTGTIPVSRFDNGTNADSSHFLRGDGIWAPASGGGGGGNWWSGFVPHAADFTTAFTGAGSNATIADDGALGTVLKANNGNTGAWVTRGWGKALPSSGAWSVKARLTANIYNANYVGAGLYLFETGTSKYAANALVFDSILYADPNNGTLTGFSARGNRYPNDSVLWARIDYDGTTNYTFYISGDGKNWLTTRVVAKTTMFTTAATHVGLGVTIQNGGTDVAGQGVSCDYWVQSW